MFKLKHEAIFVQSPIADRGYVIEGGRVVAEGKAKELLNREGINLAMLN
jgi:ABC-type branched-subunit amino acid transport system ATPase component